MALRALCRAEKSAIPTKGFHPSFVIRQMHKEKFCLRIAIQHALKVSPPTTIFDHISIRANPPQTHLVVHPLQLVEID